MKSKVKGKIKGYAKIHHKVIAKFKVDLKYKAWSWAVLRSSKISGSTSWFRSSTKPRPKPRGLSWSGS